MAKWTLTITGTGPALNGGRTNDADQLVKGLLKTLQESGHADLDVRCVSQNAEEKVAVPPAAT